MREPLLLCTCALPRFAQLLQLHMHSMAEKVKLGSHPMMELLHEQSAEGLGLIAVEIPYMFTPRTDLVHALATPPMPNPQQHMLHEALGRSPRSGI